MYVGSCTGSLLVAFRWLDGGLGPSNQLELLFWYLKVSLKGATELKNKHLRLYGIMPCHGEDFSVDDPLF